jgi:hypothetical protein
MDDDGLPKRLFSAIEIETIVLDMRSIVKQFAPNDADIIASAKYDEFKDNFPGIYAMAISATFDLVQFKQIIHYKKEMEKGTLTDMAASEQVGKILVDRYVRPLVADSYD